MKIVEALHRGEDLIDGRIRSAGLLPFERADAGRSLAQPGDEGGHVGNIDPRPIQMRLVQVVPEELEMMGAAANGVRRAVQVVKEAQVGQNGWDGQVVVIQDQPGAALRLRKQHALHLHRSWSLSLWNWNRYPILQRVTKEVKHTF